MWIREQIASLGKLFVRSGNGWKKLLGSKFVFTDFLEPVAENDGAIDGQSERQLQFQSVLLQIP